MQQMQHISCLQKCPAQEEAHPECTTAHTHLSRKPGPASAHPECTTAHTYLSRESGPGSALGDTGQLSLAWMAWHVLKGQRLH